MQENVGRKKGSGHQKMGPTIGWPPALFKAHLYFGHIQPSCYLLGWLPRLMVGGDEPVRSQVCLPAKPAVFRVVSGPQVGSSVPDPETFLMSFLVVLSCSLEGRFPAFCLLGLHLSNLCVDSKMSGAHGSLWWSN